MSDLPHYRGCKTLLWGQKCDCPRREALAEIRQLQAKLAEANSMLDYHVHEPVDCQDPFLELGEWCGSHLQEHEWLAIEPMLNGLREHFRSLQKEDFNND